MWSRLSRGCEAGYSPVDVGGENIAMIIPTILTRGVLIFFQCKIKRKRDSGGWIFHDWCLRS